MKHLILVICCFFTLITQAQITPKSRTFGGSFNFTMSDQSQYAYDVNRILLSAEPRIGQFLNDKWHLAGELSYNLSYQFEEFDVEYENMTRISSTYGLGAAATRCFPIQEKLYFGLRGFVGVNAMFRSMEVNDSQNKSEFYGGGAGITPGLFYFISPRWTVDIQFGALQYTLATRPEAELIEHRVNLNFKSGTFGLGFRYVLLPKK